MTRLYVLILGVGLGLSAVAGPVDQAMARCVEKKASQQATGKGKGSKLPADARTQARVACNLEFKPCHDDPKGGRCQAVMKRYPD
ncbi:MAG: hypothetical protein AAGE01_10800 [Pseudomonadota bacterium]